MDANGLYANRNSHGDFVKNAINELTAYPCNVYIAVAFFTEAEVIDTLINRGCRVRLIVRMGFPTSPFAIERLLNNSLVEIRYFTGHSFHPKLYLFGNTTALVGSANLTGSAILTNQEVVVSIGTEDSRLNELALLFSDYWSEAKVMTAEALADYNAIYQKFARLQNEVEKLDTEVLKKLGNFSASNINRGQVKKSKVTVFFDEFQKTYQECVSAFNVVRDVYKSQNYRKAPPDLIPLRIEIDSFISYVRDRHAQGDIWMTTPIWSGDSQRDFITKFVEQWKSTRWPHFEQNIVNINYPRLSKVFHSAETVMTATDNELFEALATLHSFYDRFRFFKDGLPTWKTSFLKANPPKHVRETLVYLVFGEGNIIERMANTIYTSDYKLEQFGQSNVQELIGWRNREELPIINGRTTKILRFFGFDVRQL